MPSDFRYFLTPLALQDIDETLAYISDELCNPQAAATLLDSLEQTMKEVCAYPYAFPDCSLFFIQDARIRHVPVGNYLAVYEIDEERRQIDLLRFRYAKTDLKNTPFKSTKS